MTAVTGCIMLHVLGAGVVDTSDVISASCREMVIRTTLQTSCSSSSKYLQHYPKYYYGYYMYIVTYACIPRFYVTMKMLIYSDTTRTFHKI